MKDNDIKVVGLSTAKAKGKTNWKITGAILGIVVLALGVIAGIVLVKQNQNINESAKECSLGGYQCPSTSDGSLLRDCSTGEIYPNDTVCTYAGAIEVCGANAATARQFCCPSAGGDWTTDLTKCPTVTSTPTATATSTAVATATATSAAGEPNSCGGTCGSNSNCQSTLFCYQGFCRNPSCSTVASCVCSGATATASSKATSTVKATATSTTKATATSTTKGTSTSKATSTSSAAPVPVTGVEWPTMLGIGFGAIMILVSLALAL